jgi:hypothetical protein
MCVSAIKGAGKNTQIAPLRRAQGPDRFGGSLNERCPNCSVYIGAKPAKNQGWRVFQQGDHHESRSYLIQ